MRRLCLCILGVFVLVRPAGLAGQETDPEMLPPPKKMPQEEQQQQQTNKPQQQERRPQSGVAPAVPPPPPRPEPPLFSIFGLEPHAGVGIASLVPNFSTDPAFQTTSGGTTAQKNFNHHPKWAPEIWVGATSSSGLGGCIHGWSLDTTASETAANNGTFTLTTPQPLGVPFPTSITAGDSLSVSGELRMSVWDFEVTQDFPAGNWLALFSAGLRYAHLSQNFNAVGVFAGTTNTLAFSHNINSAGPTFALEGRRPIYGTAFTAYLSGRGAILFGTAKQQAFLTGANNATTITTTLENAVLPVAGFELGTEYFLDLGSTQLLIQLGLVGQVWFGAGNASNVDSFDLLDGSGTPNSNLNLGLSGLALRVAYIF